MFCNTSACLSSFPDPTVVTWTSAAPGELQPRRVAWRLADTASPPPLPPPPTLDDDHVAYNIGKRQKFETTISTVSKASVVMRSEALSSPPAIAAADRQEPPHVPSDLNPDYIAVYDGCISQLTPKQVESDHARETVGEKTVAAAAAASAGPQPPIEELQPNGVDDSRLASTKIEAQACAAAEAPAGATAGAPAATAAGKNAADELGSQQCGVASSACLPSECDGANKKSDQREQHIDPQTDPGVGGRSPPARPRRRCVGRKVERFGF